MIETTKALKFLEHFSLITVGESKVPNFAWKPQQTKKLSKDKFTKQYEYKGGISTKEGRELPATNNFGIVCGFEDLECVDVDLKVFSTAKEKKEFWSEYYSFLQDNILDFDEKFSIYKTKNEGYHIIYKTKRVEGNLKIAKLEGHTEAIIETRGKGGYIFAYPDNCVNKRTYFDVDYVSDEDRSILMAISRTYDFIDLTPKEPIKKKTIYVEGDITPWEDYNNKTSIFDIIGDDFEIKHRLETSKKYVIKRHGATSIHSGYVFKDSMFAYLFSTGTIYPHETLLTPFLAYSYKYHSGNTTDAASDLYKKGFGSRLKKTLKENEPKLEIEKIDTKPMDFPLDIFPKPIQSYILECNQTLNSSIDYMGCSLIWLISVCIGNSIHVEVKPGWTEPANIWMSIVGKAGWGKTPGIKQVISPLQKLNAKKVKNYYKDLEKFNYYDSLSKKEKQEHEEIFKPTKSQFIANDITIEALVDLHQENDNAVGVFKDELAGWLKDMNKYREGSDLEFWLSCWSGSPVILTRVTRSGSFIQNPFIPVLGGIQPTILNSFYTDENKENGFMDRVLLCYPDLVVDEFSEKNIDYNTISWFNENIVNFYEIINNKVMKRDSDGEIDPLVSKFSEGARKEYIKRFNQITHRQNDEEENEYLKSMYPKQKAYIARFSLLIHVFNDYFTDGGNALEISKDSMLKAIKLSNYFIETAKKIKNTSTEVNEYKRIIGLNKSKSRRDQVKAIWKSERDFNKSEVAGIIGVSRMTIHRYIKEFENEEQKKV